MRTISYILYGIGGLWVLAAMLIVWLPVVVHLWLPDSRIPVGFPASPLEKLPGWLMWLPLPGVNASLLPLEIANALLAIPGVALLIIGEKLIDGNQ